MKLRKRCEGCSNWVTKQLTYLDSGKTEIRRSYCRSQEVSCAGCSPHYPNLTKEQIQKKLSDKRLWKF